MFLYKPQYNLIEVKSLLEGYAKDKGSDLEPNQILREAQERTGVSASELLKRLKDAKDIEAFMYLGELSLIIEYAQQKYGEMVNYQDLFVREILENGVSAENVVLKILKNMLNGQVESLAYNLNLKSKLDISLLNVMNVKSVRELNQFENEQFDLLIDKIDGIDAELKKQLWEISRCFLIMENRLEANNVKKEPLTEDFIKKVKFEKHLLTHICYFGSHNDVLKCFENDWGLEEEQALRLVGLIVEQYKACDKTIINAKQNKYVKVCLEMDKVTPSIKEDSEEDWGL